MEFDHADPAAGEMREQYAPHFEGTARFQDFVSPFADRGGPAVFAVHFEAGARTRPHVHRSGQVLYITDGTGVLGYEDGTRFVQPGDVVTVEPGEWHWHGGTPGSAMSHLTVQLPGFEDVEWNVDDRDWATNYPEP